MPPGPPSQPPSDGGDGMEARVRVLETHVEYIKEGISRLEAASAEARTDLSWIKVEFGKLATNVGHLPSKGFVVTAAISTVTVVGAILLILGRFGLLMPIK